MNDLMTKVKQTAKDFAIIRVWRCRDICCKTPIKVYLLGIKILAVQDADLFPRSE